MQKFSIDRPIAVIIVSLLLGFAAPAMAQTIVLAGVEATVPSAWQAATPTSSMRLAQFRVPAASGSQDAELVVFYFGPGQGGTPVANIARWRTQFSTPDGGQVEPVVHTFETDNMAVTQAEFQGNYARGVGMGPVGDVKPDQTLLAAIVEGPQGKLFVQLYGPTATVDENRRAFDDFVRGMQQAPD